MDAAPRGLAPGGPGATGAPLVDWVLAHPDVGGVVLGFLAPADVLGLRASCKATCAAVAAHPWDAPTPLPPPPRDGAVESWWELPRGFTVAGRGALARWRACFPAARCVGVLGVRRRRDVVTDADVAALASTGVRILALVRCRHLTRAALAGLTRLTALAVERTPLGGAAWAHLPRLDRLSCDAGPVTDAHLAALRDASRVRLRGWGIWLTDAGLAANLGNNRALTHLELQLTPGDGAAGDGGGAPACTGAGLAGCARLEVLTLGTFWDTPPAHYDVTACLAASAGSLRRLDLRGCTGLTPGVLSAMPRLASLSARDCPGFTGGGLVAAQALTALTVTGSAVFSLAAATATPDGKTGSFPALADVAVVNCAGFTGAGLPDLRSLARLEVAHCPLFTVDTLRAVAAGCPLLARVAYSQGDTREWEPFDEYDDWRGPEGAIGTVAARAALGPGWRLEVAIEPDLEYGGWVARRRRRRRLPTEGDGYGGGGGGGKRRRTEEDDDDVDRTSVSSYEDSYTLSGSCDGDE